MLMKVVGVIAEYNPFHLGHAFHLAQTRMLTGADYVIAAISGNYVQRGAPAMFDKFTRTRAALQNGADLVLELPLGTAAGSAEYFASGAVSLLQHTGIVTDLCFGSECGDLSALEYPAEILAEEPFPYRELLKRQLRAGVPYPKARAEALQQYDSHICADLLKEPNNLLGLEYLKAVRRSGGKIQPHTIRRTGSGYHEQQFHNTLPASACSIRRALLQSCGDFTPDICRQLPSAEIYASYHEKFPVTEDAFSLLLLEKLRRIQGEPLNRYFDVTEELSNRIWNHLDSFISFSQFTDLLKTKNLTRTAVSRALLHILLDIREYRPAGMLRILGFRKDASALLKAMSERGSLPLVTNPAKAELPYEQLYADRLYESVRSLLHGTAYQNEYRKKMLVI